MLPISDESSTRRFPIVTLLLIAANLSVFFVWQMKVGLANTVPEFGLVPTQLRPITQQGVLHIFTSMFMHGSIPHLLGNMWFLWIFGDNVEDEIGRMPFLIFYLASGVGAAVAHVALNAKSLIPMVGASGAISGVLGAYLILHPTARLKMLFFVRFIRMPAWCYLLIWIGFQAFSLSQAGKEPGGRIAYGAHIGGFVAGTILSILFFPRQHPKDF